MHSGIVIDQAVKGGFRFRTVDEIAEKRHEVEEQHEPSIDRKESSEDEKKEASVVYIDNV